MKKILEECTDLLETYFKNHPLGMHIEKRLRLSDQYLLKLSQQKISNRSQELDKK